MYINDCNNGIVLKQGSTLKSDLNKFLGIYNTISNGIYATDNSLVDFEKSTSEAVSPVAGNSIETLSMDKGLYITNNSVIKSEYCKIHGNYPITVNKNSFGNISYSTIAARTNSAGYYGVAANLNSIVEMFDSSITGFTGPTGPTGPGVGYPHNITTLNNSIVATTNQSDTFYVYQGSGVNAGKVYADITKGSGVYTSYSVGEAGDPM